MSAAFFTSKMHFVLIFVVAVNPYYYYLELYINL